MTKQKCDRGFGSKARCYKSHLWSLMILSLMVKEVLAHAGREFVLGFLENRIIVDYPVARIYISTISARPIRVRISVPGLAQDLVWWSAGQSSEVTYDVKAGTPVMHEFPYDIHMLGNGIENKGLWITASGDITIQAASINDLSSDAYLALPVDALGMEYYTMSYTYQADSIFYQGLSELGVVATQDDTVVQITLPPRNISIEYPGYDVVHDGRKLSLTLNQYQTYQIQSRDDMTGTKVVANKKVSVFSGTVWTSVGAEKMGDHLIEQITPVHLWGDTFITTPIATRTSGDTFRILSSQDNNTVEIKFLNANNVSKVLLHRGDFTEFDVDSDNFAYVQSEKPTLLTQFCKSYQADNNRKSDPFMTLVPPLSQFTDYYTYTTADSLTGEQDYDHYVTVLVQREGTRRFLLDGHLIKSSELYSGWTVVPHTSFRSATFRVSHGMHIIQQGDRFRFGAIGYGLKTQESYGFPLGMVNVFPWHDIDNIWEETIINSPAPAEITSENPSTTYLPTTQRQDTIDSLSATEQMVTEADDTSKRESNRTNIIESTGTSNELITPVPESATSKDLTQTTDTLDGGINNGTHWGNSNDTHYNSLNGTEEESNSSMGSDLNNGTNTNIDENNGTEGEKNNTGAGGSDDNGSDGANTNGTTGEENKGRNTESIKATQEFSPQWPSTSEATSRLTQPVVSSGVNTMEEVHISGSTDENVMPVTAKVPVGNFTTQQQLRTVKGNSPLEENSELPHYINTSTPNNEDMVTSDFVTSQVDQTATFTDDPITGSESTLLGTITQESVEEGPSKNEFLVNNLTIPTTKVVTARMTPMPTKSQSNNTRPTDERFVSNGPIEATNTQTRGHLTTDEKIALSTQMPNGLVPSNKTSDQSPTQSTLEHFTTDQAIDHSQLPPTTKRFTELPKTRKSTQYAITEQSIIYPSTEQSSSQHTLVQASMQPTTDNTHDFGRTLSEVTKMDEETPAISDASPYVIVTEAPENSSLETIQSRTTQKQNNPAELTTLAKVNESSFFTEMSTESLEMNTTREDVSAASTMPVHVPSVTTTAEPLYPEQTDLPETTKDAKAEPSFTFKFSPFTDDGNATYNESDFNSTGNILALSTSATVSPHPNAAASEEKNSNLSHILIPIGVLIGTPFLCILLCVFCSFCCKRKRRCKCLCCYIGGTDKTKSSVQVHRKMSRVSPVPSDGGSSAISSTHSQARIFKHKQEKNMMYTDPSVFSFPASQSSMGSDFLYIPKLMNIKSDIGAANTSEKFPVTRKKKMNSGKGNYNGDSGLRAKGKEVNDFNTVLRRHSAFGSNKVAHLNRTSSARSQSSKDNVSSDTTHSSRIYIDDDSENSNSITNVSNTWVPPNRAQSIRPLIKRSSSSDVHVEITECKIRHHVPSETQETVCGYGEPVKNNETFDPNDRSFVYRATELGKETGDKPIPMVIVPPPSGEIAFLPKMHTDRNHLKKPISRLPSNRPLNPKEPIAPIREKSKFIINKIDRLLSQIPDIKVNTQNRKDSKSDTSSEHSLPEPVFKLVNVPSPVGSDQSSARTKESDNISSSSPRSDSDILEEEARITHKPPKPTRRKRRIVTS